MKLDVFLNQSRKGFNMPPGPVGRCLDRERLVALRVPHGGCSGSTCEFSPMNEQQQLSRAIELLNSWIGKIQLSNAIEFFDINRVSERISMNLLNAVYGYQLLDLNDECRNFPALDLGDEQAGLAFQVTSRLDAAKIRATLKTFLTHGLEMRFPRGVKFLCLNLRCRRPRSSSAPFEYKTFTSDRDVILPEDLVHAVKRLYSSDRGRFKIVLAILEDAHLAQAGGDSADKRCPLSIKLQPRWESQKQTCWLTVIVENTGATALQDVVASFVDVKPLSSIRRNSADVANFGGLPLRLSENRVITCQNPNMPKTQFRLHGRQKTEIDLLKWNKASTNFAIFHAAWTTHQQQSGIVGLPFVTMPSCRFPEVIALGKYRIQFEVRTSSGSAQSAALEITATDKTFRFKEIGNSNG